MRKLKIIDVDATVKAIEANAGRPLPRLRESIEQAMRGEVGAVHTPEAIKARLARPVGSQTRAPVAPK